MKIEIFFKNKKIDNKVFYLDFKKGEKILKFDQQFLDNSIHDNGEKRVLTSFSFRISPYKHDYSSIRNIFINNPSFSILVIDNFGKTEYHFKNIYIYPYYKEKFISLKRGYIVFNLKFF